MTFSFDAWKDIRVNRTTHTLSVLPPKAGPAPQPVAGNLIASLIHPDRKAGIHGVQFSPDGQRLFMSGYPSGVTQLWDWAAKKEIRRIDTPPGYRGSADYALVTPDWKTLYVPVEKRTIERFEKDGKRATRVEYSGQVRVWDLDTGEEKPSLRPAVGYAPAAAILSPDGRFMLGSEHSGYDNVGTKSKVVTVIWDLVAAKKWNLCEGYFRARFAGSNVIGVNNTDATSSWVQILALSTGRELAKVRCPVKDRFFSLGAISPDGAVVAVFLGGKKAAPVEVWFFDARTLEDRGKLVGKGDPERYGWSSGLFTPDSKRFVVLDGAGNALIWNVADRSVERTLAVGGDRAGLQLALSGDGNKLAVLWAPKADEDTQNTLEPDPQDLPQPRLTLFDLQGRAAPRILVAPHGYGGGLAFSPDGKTLALGGSGAVHLFDLTK